MLGSLWGSLESLATCRPELAFHFVCYSTSTVEAALNECACAETLNFDPCTRAVISCEESFLLDPCSSSVAEWKPRVVMLFGYQTCACIILW